MTSATLQRTNFLRQREPSTLKMLDEQASPLQEEIIFPSKMYGEWRRIKYTVTGRNKEFINCTNANQLSLSFRRTLNDFVRTSQVNRMNRVSVTWITDGEWHDNERITIISETQFTREVRVNNVYCQETVRLAGSYLHLIGYNGRFWYRALFRKNFYPMTSIAETHES